MGAPSRSTASTDAPVACRTSSASSVRPIAALVGGSATSSIARASCPRLSAVSKKSLMKYYENKSWAKAPKLSGFAAVLGI